MNIILLNFIFFLLCSLLYEVKLYKCIILVDQKQLIHKNFT